MTTLLDRESVLELIEGNGKSSPCLTLCMPTHRTGTEIRGDRIQLKNLMGEAIDRLKEVGVPEGEALRLVEPIQRNLVSETFWQHRTDGVAFYVCGDFVRQVDLDHPVEPRVHVGDTFWIRPVAVQSRHAIDLMLLALTWDDAQLFRVTEGNLELAATEHFPVTREQLVGIRERDDELQTLAYAASTGRGDRGGVLFHGHGEGESKFDSDRRIYLGRVGQRLIDDAKIDRQKLIVFATEEISGRFSHVTGIEPVATIHASPAQMSQSEIAARVQPVARSLSKLDTQALRERYGAEKARGRAAEGFAAISDALEQHRVATLFVRSDTHAWGQVDGDHGLRMHLRQQEGDCDLNDWAIAQTLRTGGEVFPGDEVLDTDVPIAAMLRF